LLARIACWRAPSRARPSCAALFDDGGFHALLTQTGDPLCSAFLTAGVATSALLARRPDGWRRSIGSARRPDYRDAGELAVVEVALGRAAPDCGSGALRA